MASGCRLWHLTNALLHSSHICSELLWNTKGRHVLEQSKCLCGFNPHATKEMLGSDLSKQSGLIMSRSNVMESGRLQWAKMEKHTVSTRGGSPCVRTRAHWDIVQTQPCFWCAFDRILCHCADLCWCDRILNAEWGDSRDSSNQKGRASVPTVQTKSWT